MDFRESGNSNGAPEVLLVEDNPADAALVQTILQNQAVPHRLAIVRDGDEDISHESPRNTRKTRN